MPRLAPASGTLLRPAWIALLVCVFLFPCSFVAAHPVGEDGEGAFGNDGHRILVLFPNGSGVSARCELEADIQLHQNQRLRITGRNAR